MAVAAIILSILAILLASVSAFYTWRQAAATERATALEDERRHDERAPRFELSAGKVGPADWYRLSVRSRGHTKRLDSVQVSIDPCVDGRPGPFLGFSPDQEGVIVASGSAMAATAEYGPFEPHNSPHARRVAPNDKPHEPVIYLTIVARAGDEIWTSNHQFDVPRTRFGLEGSSR